MAWRYEEGKNNHFDERNHNEDDIGNYRKKDRVSEVAN